MKGLFMSLFKSYKLLSEDILEFDNFQHEVELEHSLRRSRAEYPVSNNVDKTLPITPIKDQGSIGSCTAFAGVSALETLIMLEHGIDDLSEQFAYSLNKLNDKWKGVSYSGSSVLAMAKVININGICHEKVCPYVKREYITPTEDMINDAIDRKAESEPVLFNQGAFVSCLDNNMPIMISFQMFKNFYKPLDGGYINTLGYRKKGGHAVMIYGYETKNNKLYFLIKNSWGKDYGYQGTCKISSDVLLKVIKSAFVVKNLCRDYKLGSDYVQKEVKKTYIPWYKRLFRKFKVGMS